MARVFFLEQRTMPKISQKKLENTKSLLLKKLSLREIAKITKVSKSTVSRVAKDMNIKTEGKNGRKRKLTDRNVTHCISGLTSGVSKTAESLSKKIEADFGIKVHRTTVSRELHKAGLRAGEKKKKPALSEKNRKERLAYAKAHRHWTVDDWKQVIFSDETKVNRFNSDGRSWTWYRDGESLQPRNVSQTYKHGGGSIMMWGCITAFGVGYLCDIEGNMNSQLYKEILEKELSDTFDYYQLDREEYVFQHDNDPKHTSRLVKNWLAEQEYKVMIWPAQSPDLNPIENCWSYLKQKLNKYERPPKGVKESRGSLAVLAHKFSRAYK